jgi:hypothetical protein
MGAATTSPSPSSAAPTAGCGSGPGTARNIGCLRAGVPVLGFVADDEGDERADRRARLIEQWNENHHRVPMTVRDDTAVLLALFDEEQMTEAAIAKATELARPQVTASLTVARSQVAVQAAERWDFLTLDQAAALAEFEDDQEALAALVQAAKAAPASSITSPPSSAPPGPSGKPRPHSPPGCRRKASPSTVTGPTCRGPWPWRTCATATGTTSAPRRTPPAQAGQ